MNEKKMRGSPHPSSVIGEKKRKKRKKTRRENKTGVKARKKIHRAKEIISRIGLLRGKGERESYVLAKLDEGTVFLRK